MYDDNQNIHHKCVLTVVASHLGTRLFKDSKKQQEDSVVWQWIKILHATYFAI